MADKTEKAAETVAEEPKIAYNPMKDMVTVNLPRGSGKEENFVFVSLNGKGYTIRRGGPVRVPRPVYDILVESMRQEQRLADWDDAQYDRMQQAAKSVGM